MFYIKNLLSLYKSHVRLSPNEELGQFVLQYLGQVKNWVTCVQTQGYKAKSKQEMVTTPKPHV